MLESKAGTVSYAMVKCGGFLKGDTDYYSLPWIPLKYDVAREVYEAHLTLENFGAVDLELDGEASD